MNTAIIRHSPLYAWGIELKTPSTDRNGKTTLGYNGVLFTAEYMLPAEYWDRRIPYLVFCPDLARKALQVYQQSDLIDPIEKRRIRDVLKGAKVKRVRLSVVTETITRAKNRSYKTTRRDSKRPAASRAGKTRR
jgi:hypothetical protein